MSTIPLRYLAELNPPVPEFDALGPGETVGFLPLEAVWSDARADHDRVAAKADVASGYTRYRPGDVVVPKVTPTFQAARSMVATKLGAGTTELHVLRPRTGVDPRWVCYAVRSQSFLREGVTAFQGVAGLQRVPPEFVNAFRVASRSPDEQRRIADFLDDRISRIDRIIAARREQVTQSAKAFDARWDAEMMQLAERYPTVPLRRVLSSIVDGPFGSSLASQHYSDSGTRVIRLGNIGIASFRDHDQAFIPDEYATILSSHAVEPGDLVMAGLGDERWPLGRCAVIPDIGPAIVKADCYRIRLTSDVDHDFAAVALSSPSVRSKMAILGRGATRARLNTEVAREAPMVLPPSDVQRDWTQRWQTQRDEVEQLHHAFARSINLLTEYKSSLITAAVTGELDVTTAGSNIPG